MLYKIFNYYLKETRAHRKVKKFTKSTFRKDEISTHKIKKMHLRKIIKKPIIVREVYTTKHKRLHANKLLKESTIVREVETTTHKEDENDEEEETSSLTTPVQVNIKRMPQTTTTMLPYFKMIVDLDEGYMVVFLIELMRIMASKDKDDLFEVLVHTEQIVLQLHENGKINWFGQPLLGITMKLAKFMTESETGVIQKYASKLNRKISARHQELSSEVNTIIDYADMLYDDEEGTKLFNVLKDFDDYPNILKPGYSICLALIESFLKPYRRLSNTKLRQRLLDSINLELRARSALIGFFGIKEARKLRPLVASGNDTTVQFSRKKQKKFRHKLQKLKSKPKHQTNKRKHTKFRPDYSNGNIFRRRLSYTPENQYKYPLLRNMKPITSIQRRYKIVTPTHRHMLRHRSTRSYIVNLISRPTKEFTTKLNIEVATNQANTRFPFLHETVRFRTHLRHREQSEK
ncbi:unnamed protein product [Spodoptera littoralis]|uniref:Uncharacterized protein n=1 Tax=Spodoptera littoralis TaxID=7109 RepID=A0A9P0I7R3_SPOLI|nr:unnamed protein product [Spodoptera littoralis]